MPADEPSTSTTLLNSIKQGNETGWLEFCSLYGPLVYSWARRAGLQNADAADVAQEVFLSVKSGIEAYRRDRPGDKLRAWLWTITRNCVRKYCNSQQSAGQATGGTDAQLFMESLTDILDSEEMPDEQATNTRLAKRALEMIRVEFNERTWQAFWRMCVAGHSAAEIGKDLDLSQAAVRQAKYRVLHRLREVLEEM